MSYYIIFLLQESMNCMFLELMQCPLEQYFDTQRYCLLQMQEQPS